MFGIGASSTGNAAAGIRALGDRLARTRPLIERMTERAAASERANIDESHGPDGESYPPLAPSTLAGRGKNHPFGDLPLKDTGLMYESIHAEVRDDNTGWAGPHALDAYYFPYQQHGAPRANIPERPFIGIADEDVIGWGADVADFARQAVNGG